MSTDAIAHHGPLPRSGSVLWERACFAFVLLVWLQCLLSTHALIAACGLATPLGDDGTLFFNRSIGQGFWSYLWAQHNEHRVPLPKLLQALLYDWTGDIRSGMYLQAQMYGAIALACVLAARRLRGGSRPWDIFFPLTWLQLGNCLNLLMGFQVGIALPGACACAVLLCGVLSPQRLLPSRALATGLGLLCLPLCGGGGLLQLPPLALYTAWLGFTNRRNADARERAGARMHLCFALAAVALAGLYMLDYHRPGGSNYAPGPHSPLKLAVANLSAPFGPDYFGWRPIVMPAITLGALLLALTFARRGLRARDPRTLGTLALLAGGAMLICGIALGRPMPGPDIVPDRYMPLPAPFFVALTLGSLVLLERRWRELALVVACALMLCGLPGSIRFGVQIGGSRIRIGNGLDQLVAMRASWTKVAEYFANTFGSGSLQISDQLLAYYAEQGLPPFVDAKDYLRVAREYEAFLSVPTAVRSEEPLTNRFLDGEMVCCLQPPTSFEFAVGAQNRRLVFQAGVPEMLLRSGRHPGLRAEVILKRDGQAPLRLGEIALDPLKNAAERGYRPFEFSWEPGGAGVLKLVFLRVPSAQAEPVADRVAVFGVRVE